MGKERNGKPTLAEVVSSRGELVPEWEATELSFGPDVELPPETQREILRNYLLVTDDFTRACQLCGIQNEELIEQLRQRIPKRWLAMRKALEYRPDLEIEVNKNPEVVLPLVGDGLKYAEKARMLSEFLFQDLSLSPKALKDLMLTWAGIWDRVLPVLDSGKTSPKKLPSGLGDLSKDVMITMRERVREFEIRRAAQELKQQDIDEALEVEVEEIEPEKLGES